VSEYVLYCWRKLSIMACKTTEDKFMMYLNWYASEVGSNDVTLPFARMEDCATFLGVARTSLSPAIGRLVASGEIAQPARGRFVLCRGKRALMEPSEMSNLRHTVCVEFAIMPQASNKVSNERRRAAVPQVARTSKACCGKEGN